MPENELKEEMVFMDDELGEVKYVKGEETPIRFSTIKADIPPDQDRIYLELNKDEAIKLIGALRAALYAHMLDDVLTTVHPELSTPEAIARLSQALVEEAQNEQVDTD